MPGMSSHVPGLVIVFPSSKAASIALASLLVDPFASEGPMTAQKVPASLWPSEFKRDRRKAAEEDLTMDTDETGGAGESSDVMEGHLEIRWARLEDKKARTNVSPRTARIFPLPSCAASR